MIWLKWRNKLPVFIIRWFIMNYYNNLHKLFIHKEKKDIKNNSMLYCVQLSFSFSGFMPELPIRSRGFIRLPSISISYTPRLLLTSIFCAQNITHSSLFQQSLWLDYDCSGLRCFSGIPTEFKNKLICYLLRAVIWRIQIMSGTCAVGWTHLLHV